MHKLGVLGGSRVISIELELELELELEDILKCYCNWAMIPF
jgi:hypothetical protein